MFGIFSGDFVGDILGYFLVVSILFLPVVAFIPYVIYETVERFPWAESQAEWRGYRNRRRARKAGVVVKAEEPEKKRAA